MRFDENAISIANGVSDLSDLTPTDKKQYSHNLNKLSILEWLEIYDEILV